MKYFLLSICAGISILSTNVLAADMAQPISQASGTVHTGTSIQQRFRLIRARALAATGSVKPVVEKPQYITLGTFLTDVCSRLGKGAPLISKQVTLNWVGVDTGTVAGRSLYTALKQCVYLGILEQRSTVPYAFDRPVRRRFVDEFFRTKLFMNIAPEQQLADDDYVTSTYWEEAFQYRVPTYYAIQRLLQLSARGSDTAYSNPLLESKHFEAMAQVYTQLQQNYHYLSGGVTDETLLYGAMQGMVESLHDTYSVYFPPEKSTDFFNSIQGEYYGIGAYVDAIDGYFTLQSLIKGSPAVEAGLEPGDRVIAVDDWLVPTGFTVNEVVAKIKGPVGTHINLTILRDGVKSVFRVERRKISIPLLTMETRGDAFVWTISSFGQGLDSQFEQSFIDHKAEIVAAKKLVIDLRHNGGGYTDVVARMLQNFVASGDVMLQYDYAYGTEIVRSEGGFNKQFSGKKMYVLVDGSTASASEIMAGVIKEYVPGVKIIGEQTFGKGTMQTIIGLPSSASIKYTIALWYYGASKTSIEKTGITPDIKVVDDRTTVNDEVLDAVSRD